MVKYILLQLYEYKSNDYRCNTNPRASELIVKEICPKFTFVNPSISPFFFLNMAQFCNGTNKANSTWKNFHPTFENPTFSSEHMIKIWNILPAAISVENAIRLIMVLVSKSSSIILIPLGLGLLEPADGINLWSPG